MTTATRTELLPVPTNFDRHDVEQFLYREARYADLLPLTGRPHLIVPGNVETNV